MLCIDKAEYVGGYNINIMFNNGMEGIANLEETICTDKRPIFLKLKEQLNFIKEQLNFINFKLAHGTIIWCNELDLAPEYLFFLAFKNNPDLQEKFKLWQYVN
jgi:hypothetical protein